MNADATSLLLFYSLWVFTPHLTGGFFTELWMKASHYSFPGLF